MASTIHVAIDVSTPERKRATYSNEVDRWPKGYYPSLHRIRRCRYCSRRCAMSSNSARRAGKSRKRKSLRLHDKKGKYRKAEEDKSAPSLAKAALSRKDWGSSACQSQTQTRISPLNQKEPYCQSRPSRLNVTGDPERATVEQGAISRAGENSDKS